MVSAKGIAIQTKCQSGMIDRCLICFLYLFCFLLPHGLAAQSGSKNLPLPPSRPAMSKPEASGAEKTPKTSDAKKTGDQDNPAASSQNVATKPSASDYEKPRHLTARDILGDKAIGPNYKIREDVGRANFSRVYTIDTEFGSF